MAAAFVLGAEGVQMGTRMVSAAESPVHDNWKAGDRRRGRDRHRVPQPHASPALRALRTDEREHRFDTDRNAMAEFATPRRPLLRWRPRGRHRACGQVAGRIDAVRPVADIIAETVREFGETVSRLQGSAFGDEVQW